MGKDKIEELLQTRFAAGLAYPRKRRIIFWYDKEASFEDLVQNLHLKNVELFQLHKMKNRKEEEVIQNAFQLKYEVEYLHPDKNYLVYANFERIDKKESLTWDMEAYSEFFQANTASFLLEDFSLNRKDPDLLKALEDYSSFFANKERREKFQRLLHNPLEMNRKDLENTLLAVAVSSKSTDFRAIVRRVLLDPSLATNIEKWFRIDVFLEKIKEHFQVEIASLEDFLKTIVVVHFYYKLKKKPKEALLPYFQGNRNELYMLAENLFQQESTREGIHELFQEMSKKLDLMEEIQGMELEEIITATSFSYIDYLCVLRIAEQLDASVSDLQKYQEYVNLRLQNSPWKEKFRAFYEALLSASRLLAAKEKMALVERSDLRDYFKDYCQDYYKIDQEYRNFFTAYEKRNLSLDIPSFDNIANKITLFYEEEFLDEFLELWNKKIEDRANLPQQNRFYQNYIKNSPTRVAVIISDALRYEVGEEIYQHLKKESKASNIELKAMLSDLPSVTSVGMTNLLPAEGRDIDLLEGKMTAHGISTMTTENREKILQLAEKDSSAISFDNFQEFQRSEQEEYIKGKKVIYIYHDSIDAIGDKAKTEARTYQACETAIEDLTKLGQLLSNLGVVSIYMTSDHGFLYENTEVKEYNKIELAGKYKKINKRYTISEKEIKEKACISLPVHNAYCNFPKKNQRIKCQGAGLRFVHGGSSPQEMIVPLIHYQAGKRATQSIKVGVQIKDTQDKLTSHTAKFTVYQLDAVNLERRSVERNIEAALYAGEDRISDSFRLCLNATKENTEYSFSLTFQGEREEVSLIIKDADTGTILDSKAFAVHLGILDPFAF